MKTKKFIIATIFGIMSVIITTAQTKENTQNEKSVKTETFKVYGNCGMCKNRIEGSLSDLAWVKKAKWNVGSKMMSVTWEGKDHSFDEIIEQIVAVGHDTKQNSASDKVYNNLPGCCQYTRIKEENHKKEHAH